MAGAEAAGGSGDGSSAAAAAAPADAPASALDSWIAFGLNARRATLDQEGILMARRQDASSESRKELAVATKSFKRSKVAGGEGDVAAASKAFNALLKMYQGEVDRLTSRAKESETAYLSLYRALYDVPDPVGDLRKGAADRDTLTQLREEMRALRMEHSGLAERSAAAGEYEARIDALEAANKALSARVAEDVRAQVEEKQAQWNAAQRKAIDAYEMREEELLHQLSIANADARERQTALDALKQQRDDARAQVTDLKNARTAGAEMIVEDGVRARDEANELRRRCMQLEAQVSALSAEDPQEGGTSSLDPALSSSSLVGRSALSAELAARDVEVSQLKDQVAALEGVLTGQDAEKSSEFTRLTTAISEKDKEIVGLKKTIEGLPAKKEFETMRRQFESLKAFQLNEEVPDPGDEMMSVVSSSTGADGAAVGEKSHETSARPVMDLEKRLLTKLKLMETRSASMRVELSGKESRIEELSDMVRSLEERNDDQKSLISKLEDGINAMTGDPSNVKGLKARLAAEGSSAGLSSGRLPLRSASELNGEQGKESDPSAAWDWGEQQQAAGLQKIIQNEPTMLDIVAGQRDRFRERNLELENDNRKAAERLERVTADTDRLRTDNVRLYEKIRYLQSYTQASAARASGSAVASERMAPASSMTSQGAVSIGRTASSTSIAMGPDDDDEGGGFLNQYRSMYEEMVNPYTLFNRRERQKRINEMSAPERLTLRATQRAVSTKTSRIFVFVYALCLHVLVFVVLGFASTGGCVQDGGVTTKAEH